MGIPNKKHAPARPRLPYTVASKGLGSSTRCDGLLGAPAALAGLPNLLDFSIPGSRVHRIFFAGGVTARRLLAHV